ATSRKHLSLKETPRRPVAGVPPRRCYAVTSSRTRRLCRRWSLAERSCANGRGYERPFLHTRRLSDAAQGHKFHRCRNFGAVAQLGEHLLCKQIENIGRIRVVA